jgi:hypothetical protein
LFLYCIALTCGQGKSSLPTIEHVLLIIEQKERGETPGKKTK